MRAIRSLVVGVAAIALAACGDRTMLPDGSPATPGFGGIDAGVGVEDASGPSSEVDATRADAGSPPVGPGVPLACNPSYLVDPRALVGCRNPSEPGCATCCAPADDGRNCSRFSWGPGPEPTNVEPWYNGIELLSGACPSACAPCASCFTRDEKDLCSLFPNPAACACPRPFVNDACEQPEGCDCYCERYEAATAACRQR